MRMKFGVDKCKILIIDGNEEITHKDTGKLLGKELEIVEEIKYLGVTIDKKGTEKEQNGIRKKQKKCTVL